MEGTKELQLLPHARGLTASESLLRKQVQLAGAKNKSEVVHCTPEDKMNKGIASFHHH